jgi:FtsH-binding integral membrane protein
MFTKEIISSTFVIAALTFFALSLIVLSLYYLFKLFKKADELSIDRYAYFVG